MVEATIMVRVEGKDQKGIFPAAVDFSTDLTFHGTIYSRWNKKYYLKQL